LIFYFLQYCALFLSDAPRKNGRSMFARLSR
jgi:hypothetical protein